MAPVSRSTACSALCARCVRPVLHLRDARVGVVRMLPVRVAALLRAGPIQPRQIRPRRRGNAGCGCQSPQKRLVALPRVPADDTPQRRVRFQRRRIDADRRAADEARVGQSLQHPREDRFVRLEVDSSPRSRHRRVVRRCLRQRDVEELPEAQRIARPPRNRAFRIQAFEVAQKQHPEVAARRQTWPADPVRVELRTLRLDQGVEARLVEDTVQPLVERVARASRQIRAGHPHRPLPRTGAAFAHRHRN